MLATIRSATLLGVRGHAVAVEVHVSNGLPGCTIVGLPDAACREARDRVRAAVLSSTIPWPQRRITVNLAPSAVPKTGTSLDLALAVGVLVAEGHVPLAAVEGRGFVGELGLDGVLRPVPGMVPLVASLTAGGGVEVVTPLAAVPDALLVPGATARGASTLAELVSVLKAERPWPDPPVPPPDPPEAVPDLAEVRGQPVARTVVEIAAAGGHHLLLVGPPGAGKTLLATRLPGLLPVLDDAAALEVTGIWSAAAQSLPGRLVRRPPFRAPHHTASAVSLIGGGTAAMRPGEISLAHRGVLFCDELGEFPPSVLDALRQPLEEGIVRVCRARGTVTFPARFQFVAATNPCPCGEGGTRCRCSDAGRLRYQRRLSGPLLDRFDVRLDVPRPEAGDLLGAADGEPSAVVAARVAQARELAAARGLQHGNAGIAPAQLAALAPLTPPAARLLERAVRAGRLTGRGVHRVRRVARTVADLDGHEGRITEDHVSFALALRAEPVGTGVLG